MDVPSVEDIEKFRKLKVWQKAHALVLHIYEASKSFPPHERYGLVSQMQRAAISVAANIAEGTQRPSARDRHHFHVMAMTSLDEVKYYFILAHDLGYIATELGRGLMNDAREVGGMLRGLDRSF